MIPSIDLEKLSAGDAAALEAMREAATGVGFATVFNTALTGARVREVIETYRAFFKLPEAEKQPYSMAGTGANRGWGAAGTEQVDPDANPDYKQYFDSGVILPEDDPRRGMPVYAPNIWPAKPAGFEAVIARYYEEAREVAMAVLRGVAQGSRRPWHCCAGIITPSYLTGRGRRISVSRRTPIMGV